MVAIDRVLCPVDLSSCSRAALQHALAIARWYEAKVTVLHVFRQVQVVDTAAAALGAGLYAPPVALPEVDRKEVQRHVAEFVAHTPGAGDVAVHTCEGINVREEILREAEAIDADLLVLGSHGLTGVKRLVLGSVAENVLRHSPRPVLIVPAHASEAHLAPLREAGLDDRAIHDAVQVVSYFSYINRIADGLGVDLEPEME